jgi:hypothetical protein
MTPQLNIIGLMDSAAVLAENTFAGHLFIADNANSEFSSGQGTQAPCTGVFTGQVLNWKSYPINLQTDAFVSGIRWFKNHKLITTPDDEPVSHSKLYGSPDTTYWAAIMNAIEPGYYQYQLQFNIVGKIMWMTSFAQIYVIGKNPITTGDE